MPTLSKNIFWSSISAFLQVYSGGVIFIILAKIMSIQDFGILNFGFSLATLLTTCFDFGHSLMIVKDYPQKKFPANDYVFNVLFQKRWVILIFTIIFFTYLWFFYEEEWFYIGVTFMGYALFSVFVLYLQALMRAKNEFNKYTVSVSIYAILITVVIGAFYLYNITFISLVLLMIFSKLVQLLFSFFLCKNDFRNIKYNFEIHSYIKKNSWSYAAHYIFGVFYFNIDTQLISIYLNAEQVALYQSVFKLIYIFLICSEVVSSALLPYLSSKIAERAIIDEKANDIFYFLLVIGCSLFLFFISLYKPIIEMLYSDKYHQAYLIVLPLGMLIVLRTIGSIYGNLLTISNHQTNRVKIVAISLVVSLVLNIIVIPIYGIRGAAWSSVIVHLVLLFGYYFYSKQEFLGLRIVSKDTCFVLLLTFILFVINYYLIPDNFISILFSVLLWCFLIYSYSYNRGKILFLRTILKDKGVR